MELPRGVRLFRTLEGHQDMVLCVAFDPYGEVLASGSIDKTIKFWEPRGGDLRLVLDGYESLVSSVAFHPRGGVLATGDGDDTVRLWDVRSGNLLRALKGHGNRIASVAFHPQGEVLASGSFDSTVKLWESRSGQLLRTIEGHGHRVSSVAFDLQSGILASGSVDKTVKLWDPLSGKLSRVLEGHQDAVLSVAFDPDGKVLATASADSTVRLWDFRSGKLLRTLEGHTASVDVVAFTADGRLLASKSRDGTIRLWACETWETVAVLPEPAFSSLWVPALAFHPTLPLLATASLASYMPQRKSRRIHLWELDYDVLLDQHSEQVAAGRAVHHTTGKIVLVGDHSVGKSALGYRLIYDRFEKQESTHGQQFWVFPALGMRRGDGTDCEAILWDFAGQPDYRLVHALFVGDADLALVLFDASDLRDPLHGVGFWLKQLQAGKSGCPTILVAAQADRGTCSLTPKELSEFCSRQGIEGPITTSSLTGEGMSELIECMRTLIPWDDKPATVTTSTFKRIKDFVLSLKEVRSDGRTIVTTEELRGLLEDTDPSWAFTDAEMVTAVGHMENYGYVNRLRTSNGDSRILLQPDRLNNLASSFVLEARRNPKGLGALEEKRLLAGGYDFIELKDLDPGERDMLLDSAALLFLENNVCFRETDPLRVEPYLIFPELINLKKPPEEDTATQNGVAYTVSGPTENVFASLVVLLGYTHTFTRTAQWYNNARYEVGDGLACGFRLEAERDGELDFVLLFGPKVGPPVRTLFQGLFESFLARRNLTVLRYEPVTCSRGHAMNRAVLREAMQSADESAFCSKCGEGLTLPRIAEPIQLTREVQVEVESQRRVAEQRTLFEQAVFRVSSYVAERRIKAPECFISYAWGDPEHERWVEKQLATDLKKAGVAVLLDRWDNAQIGASVQRFVERIDESECVVVVGTPLYLKKAQQKAQGLGHVVAAELDLVGIRLIASEERKRTVLPILLAGKVSESFPPLLRGRVYGDFRMEEAYFSTAFDLILSLYRLPLTHPAVADLRDLLRAVEVR